MALISPRTSSRSRTSSSFVPLSTGVVIRARYGPAYQPAEHWIEMGVEERAESIVGVVFRNVSIGRR